MERPDGQRPDVHGRRAGRRTVVGALIASTTIVTVNGAPARGAASPAAQAVASNLFRAIAPFTDATREPRDESVGSVLDKAGSGAPAGADAADVHAYYTMSGDAVGDFGGLAMHAPPGSKYHTEDFGGTPADEILFLYQPASGIAQEGVQFTIAPATGGKGTALRVDGWALAQPPRPASERVSGAVRSVAVLAVKPTGQIPPAGASRMRPVGSAYPLSTVTSPGSVRALADWANSRPPAPPFRKICAGLYTGPLYELQFQNQAKRGLVTAEEDDCGNLDITVRGHSAPPLAEASVLAAGHTITPATGLNTLLWSQHALPLCTSRELTGPLAKPVQLPPQPTGGGPVPAPTLTENEMGLALQDTSPRACTVDGTPQLALLDAHKSPLPTAVTATGTPPPIVTLTPKSETVAALTWPLANESCTGPTVSSINVTIPGTHSTVQVPTGTADDPFAPCMGKLTTTPFT